MFSAIWLKVAAGLTGVIGFLAVLLKFKNHQVEELKEANEGYNKKEEIRENIKKAEEKSKKVEKNAQENNNGDDWRSNI